MSYHWNKLIISHIQFPFPYTWYFCPSQVCPKEIVLSDKTSQCIFYTLYNNIFCSNIYWTLYAIFFYPGQDDFKVCKLKFFFSSSVNFIPTKLTSMNKVIVCMFQTSATSDGSFKIIKKTMAAPLLWSNCQETQESLDRWRCTKFSCLNKQDFFCIC